jgi:hypothetical protein
LQYLIVLGIGVSDQMTPKVLKKYLIRKINEAKEATGYDRVDIVAHSLGGLLTRVYVCTDGIDCTGDLDCTDGKIEYNNDIGRFAMLGTPNHGTWLAYGPWAGGDVLANDWMVGDTGVYDIKNPKHYFNSRVLNRDFRNKHNGNDLIKCSELRFNSTKKKPEWVYYDPILIGTRKYARDYIRNNISILQTVMPYNDFLLENTDLGIEIKDDKSKNDLLPDLNKQDEINKLIGENKRIEEVIIFGSQSEETIKQLIVDHGPIEGVYEEGVPKIVGNRNLDPVDFAVRIEGDTLGTSDETGSEFPEFQRSYCPKEKVVNMVIL